MNAARQNKSGAALIIALGFLAILTVAVIAFSLQTRTERLSGRAFVTTAQTRHLLHTALARAMEEIDQWAGTNYPNFFVRGSFGDTGIQMTDSIDFAMEQDFFPAGNNLIYGGEYITALDTALWDSVTDAEGKCVGRIGYLVVNTSGLLDANHVGGISDGNFTGRKAGLFPDEIQLAADNNFINEFNSSANTFPHITESNPQGSQQSSTNALLSAGLAFVHNRENDWRRFETLRDLYKLNRISNPKIITTDISSFCTFSYDPRDDRRVFMGNDTNTLATSVIRNELSKIEEADADFVINQLHDYIDSDTIPVDSKKSVEPVPLINEILLTLESSFKPNFSKAGNVESVTVTSTNKINVEIWYPFIVIENTNTYEVGIYEPSSLTGDTQSFDLLGNTAEWPGSKIIPDWVTVPNSVPCNINLHSHKSSFTVNDEGELIGLFEELAINIDAPEFYCIETEQNIEVDLVDNFTFPLKSTVENQLLPIIEDIASQAFSGTQLTTNFSMGKATFDPRMNWDADDDRQWATVGNMSDYNASLGEPNDDLLNTVETPDKIGMAYIRNEGRIDTPFELTYLLYSPNRPWKTFQMLEPLDDDDTRFILDNLSPYPNGPPRHGRINPYTPQTNVIASAFMGMPTDEFNNTPHRFDENETLTAANFFIQHINANGWPENASGLGLNINIDELNNITGNTDNPWIWESLFRNSYELFNPRDTLYTIILAAQSGTDVDSDGLISDEEVRGTQKAVVYIWRDPVTQRSACVFFGLSDTLQNTTISGQEWSKILDEFSP